MIKRSFKDLPNTFFHMIGFVMVFVLFLCYILTLNGKIDLTVINTVKIPNVFDNLILCTIFTVDIVFVSYICLRPISIKDCVFISLGFLPVYFVGSFVITPNTAFILSTVLPLIYIFIISVIKKCKILQTLIRSMFLLVLLLPNQLILRVIRLKIFGIQITNFSTLTEMTLRIDNIIMLLILLKEVDFLVKLVEIYFRWRSNTSEFRISRQRRSVQRDSGESKSEIPVKEVNQRGFDNWKQALYFNSIKYGIFFSRLGGILLISYIFDVYYEMIIMLVVFWLGRSILKDIWHGDTIKQCTISTLIGFTLLARLTLPLSISILFSVILSGLFIFTLYVIGRHFKEIEVIKKTITELQDKFAKQDKFDYKTCSMDEFYNHCQRIGLKPKDVDFAWKAIRLNMPYKELAEEFVYSVDSIKNKKSSLLKRLNCEID